MPKRQVRGSDDCALYEPTNRSSAEGQIDTDDSSPGIFTNNNTSAFTTGRILRRGAHVKDGILFTFSAILLLTSSIGLPICSAAPAVSPAADADARTDTLSFDSVEVRLPAGLASSVSARGKEEDPRKEAGRQIDDPFIGNIALRRPTNEVPLVVQEARRNVSPREDHPSGPLPPVHYEDHPFDLWGGVGFAQRRRAAETEPSPHRPIRIKFDTTQLPPSSADPQIQLRLDAIVNQILPAVRSVWSTRLSVVPVRSAITATFESSCAPLAPGYGRVGTEPLHVNMQQGGGGDGEEDEDVFDLIIFVTAEDVYFGEEACVNDVTAFAYVCELDQFDRPIVGTINFCLGSILFDSSTGALTESELQNKIGIATHETAHVLGVGGAYLKFFRNSTTGEPLTPRGGSFAPTDVVCVDGSIQTIVRPSETTLAAGVDANGGRHFEVVTERVRTVVRNHFDCETMSGARLENQPTNALDCFGSHWDERLFSTELLSAVYNPVTNTLSPLTLALLEDSGWYVANYSDVSVTPFGHAAGCDFVNEDCIVGGEVPSYARGFFCDRVGAVNAEGLFSGPLTCDPSHTRMAFCDLTFHEEEVPASIERFGNPNTGPLFFTLADHCPMPIIPTLDCRDSANTLNIPGETVGSVNSKCFNGVFDSVNSGPTPHPVCLEALCNEDDRTLEVRVFDDTLVCAEGDDFRSVPYPGWRSEIASFECPRLAAVCPGLFCPANCSGRGVCDYKHQDGAKCICFDDRDTSPGCSGLPEQDLGAIEAKESEDATSSATARSPSSPPTANVPLSDFPNSPTAETESSTRENPSIQNTPNSSTVKGRGFFSFFPTIVGTIIGMALLS